MVGPRPPCSHRGDPPVPSPDFLIRQPLTASERHRGPGRRRAHLPPNPQTLPLTARTVDSHCTNVFNQPDVMARTGLPIALAIPTKQSTPKTLTGRRAKKGGSARGSARCEDEPR